MSAETLSPERLREIVRSPVWIRSLPEHTIELLNMADQWERERSGPCTSTAINSTGRTYTGDEARAMLRGERERSGAHAEPASAREFAERVTAALSDELFQEIARLQQVIARGLHSACDHCGKRILDAEQRAEAAESALRESQHEYALLIEGCEKVEQERDELQEREANLTADLYAERERADGTWPDLQAGLQAQMRLETELSEARAKLAKSEAHERQAWLELEAERALADRLARACEEAQAGRYHLLQPALAAWREARK